MIHSSDHDMTHRKGRQSVVEQDLARLLRVLHLSDQIDGVLVLADVPKLCGRA